MKNRGFTLTEVLAAITILGIVLLIAVPSISKLRDTINRRAIKHDAEMFIALAKEYIETHPELYEEERFLLSDKPVKLDLSKIDDSKFNGDYTSGSITASNCSVIGLKYKCNEYKVVLKNSDYRAEGTEVNIEIKKWNGSSYE